MTTFRRFVSDFSDWFWDPCFLPRGRCAAVRDFFGALRFACSGRNR